MSHRELKAASHLIDPVILSTGRTGKRRHGLAPGAVCTCVVTKWPSQDQMSCVSQGLVSGAGFPGAGAIIKLSAGREGAAILSVAAARSVKSQKNCLLIKGKP
ncbi:hypothetical protein [Paraburkholderia gardini]|uniref:hypothetical protein n=1 Tax=Paraburkholderia gardini TaxID=2823469 RepID=UPI002B4B9DF7|nr:hypothetical protein [Paraburkholderia gardini]